MIGVIMKAIKIPEGFKIEKIYIHKPLPAIADLDAIESVVSEGKENLDCDVGDNILIFTAVPSGKIHIITNIIAFSGIGAPATVTIFKKKAAMEYRFRRKTTVAVNDEIIFNGIAILDEGWELRIIFSGMVLHDIIYADIVGYQISKY